MKDLYAANSHALSQAEYRVGEKVLVSSTSNMEDGDDNEDEEDEGEGLLWEARVEEIKAGMYGTVQGQGRCA